MVKLIYLFIFIINFINYKNDLLDEEQIFLKFPFNTKTRAYPEGILNDPYNETDFINDYLDDPIFMNISIGTPKQQIKVKLDQNEKCFKFIRDKKIIEYNDKHLNNNNYTQVTLYNKKDSVTARNGSTTKYDINKEYNILYDVEDVFYLNEYSDVNNISIKNESTYLNFLYGNNYGDEEIVYGNIGIDMNNYKDILCPRFGYSLKNLNLIKKNVYYFDFYSNFHGYFYIGAEPHFFNIKYNNYKDYQYLKLNTGVSKDGFVNWSLSFNKIILMNKTNDYTHNLKEKMVQFDFNSGLFIGTTEYQEYIEQNFFNELIKIKICNKTLVNYSYNNTITKYYIYKCNKTLQSGENFDKEKYKPYNNYFGLFPDFQLFHVNLEHNFYISNYDLFKPIHNNFYFLIIFDAEKENKIWKFGHFFFRIHQLIFDYDSKIIGYYDRRIEPPKNDSDKKKSDDNEDQDDKGDKDNKDGKKNKNNKKIFIYIALFIVVCIIVAIAFYLGMKYKESRKKRANELIDDNYDYDTADNNNIKNNNIINN